MSRTAVILLRAIIVWGPVILFLVIIEQSSHFKSCIQQKAADYDPQKQVSDIFVVFFTAHKECWGQFIIKFKDELIVVFTAFLTFATILLWIATRDLLKSTERTARQQYRSYVFVGEIVLINEQPSGCIARINIRNSGLTPAYGLTILWSAKTFWGNEVRKFEAPKATERSSKTDLGPSAQAQAEMRLTDILNERGIAALKTGELELYAFGVIAYRDAFDRKQRTEFRFMMGGHHKWPSDNRFIVTQDGNEAT